MMLKVRKKKCNFVFTSFNSLHYKIKKFLTLKTSKYLNITNPFQDKHLGLVPLTNLIAAIKTRPF